MCGNWKDYLIDHGLHKSGLYWALSSNLHHSHYHPHHKPILFFSNSKDDVDNLKKRGQGLRSQRHSLAGQLLDFVYWPLVRVISTKLRIQMKKMQFKGVVDFFKRFNKDVGVGVVYRDVINLCQLDLFPIMAAYQMYFVLGTAGLVG